MKAINRVLQNLMFSPACRDARLVRPRNKLKISHNLSDARAVRPYNSRFCNTLKATAAVVVLIWLAVSAVLVVRASGMHPVSDSAYYLGLARDCVAAGLPYPLVSHVAAEPYIANPGYINLLAAALCLPGGAVAALWLNVVLNCALLGVLFCLVRRLCGATVAVVFVILFCVLPSNSFIVESYMSDLPCALAAYGALLAATWPGARHAVLAAVLLTVANYIRPVAMTFAAALVLCMLLGRTDRRRWVAFGVALVASTAALWMLNGALTGTRYCFSTTGGVNAIQGACDSANGGYNADVFAYGQEGYIPDDARLDVFQKDSVWRSRAIDWAAEHPGRFLSFIPRKLYVQMFNDSFHHSLLRETSEGILTPEGRMAPAYRREVVAESVPYYLVLMLAACGVVMLLRARRRRLVAVALALVAMNLCMAALTVGAPRYHYPVMPVFLMLAAVAVARLTTPALPEGGRGTCR